MFTALALANSRADGTHWPSALDPNAWIAAGLGHRVSTAPPVIWFSLAATIGYLTHLFRIGPTYSGLRWSTVAVIGVLAGGFSSFLSAAGLSANAVDVISAFTDAISLLLLLSSVFAAGMLISQRQTGLDALSNTGGRAGRSEPPETRRRSSVLQRTIHDMSFDEWRQRVLAPEPNHPMLLPHMKRQRSKKRSQRRKAS
jgi:hypothetical protein